MVTLEHLIPFSYSSRNSNCFIDTIKVLDKKNIKTSSEFSDHQCSVNVSAALLGLKSSSEFRKKAVWTRAYGW